MELYLTPPDENQWDLLPEEIACEIITRITDVRSLLNYMQTSKTFYRLARLCTQVIDSPVKVEIPLSYFTGFQNLRVIGEQIVLTITPSELFLLSTLPNLRVANLELQNFRPTLLESWWISLADLFLLVLQGLNIDRKVPEVNFKIKGGYGGLIIQGNRFGLIRLGDEPRQSVSDSIRSRYPQLEYLDFDDISRELLSRTIKSFLLEGDFGLTDPSRPPSDSNPPLAQTIHRFVDSGLMSTFSLLHLTEIYVRYHGLYHGDTIVFDDFIRRYFQPLIIVQNAVTEHIEKSYNLATASGESSPKELMRLRRMIEARPILPLDRIARRQLFDYVRSLTLRGVYEYDLPVPLAESEMKQIEQRIHNINRHYTSGRPYYTTDGRLITPQ